MDRLGYQWGFRRPLYAAELGRALRLTGIKPGRTVMNWIEHKKPLSGPVSAAIDTWLAGAKPPDLEHIRKFGR